MIVFFLSLPRALLPREFVLSASPRRPRTLLSVPRGDLDLVQVWMLRAGEMAQWVRTLVAQT